MRVEARLEGLLELLAETEDVLSGRVHDPVMPRWCEARGWAPFLLSLSDAELERAEARGLREVLAARADAPPALAELGARVRSLTRVDEALAAVEPRKLRRASDRKKRQVEAVAALARAALPTPRRIVDVGAGLGHLTKVLAEDLGRPAVGLELQPERVEVARTLADGATSFLRWDARAAPPPLDAGDLVVGLHACGDLGDVIASHAAGAGADVLLVSCCPQKIAEETRPALSRLARARRFVADRGLLGLANVSARPLGVESSMREIMASRQTRYALRLLLRERGVACEPGEESQGINRRRMRGGIAKVASAALRSRGLGDATAGELAAAEERAEEEFGVIRRASLPRAMLARALEVAVVADRAMALAEAGYVVELRIAFDADTSPRNLALIARAPRVASSPGR